MVKSTFVRVLYVGRRSKISETLGAIINTHDAVPLNGGDAPGYYLDYWTVTNQKDALRLIRTQPPHILLVETDTKPNSRARFGEMVRYRLPTAAIVAVSKSEPQGEFQFDDFMPAPLDRDRVMAVILRICNDSEGYQLQLGDILLNIATRTVTTPNGRYRMTPKQCLLLQLLMSHNGEVVARKDIMRAVWNTAYMDDTRTLDVHIRWLRERIEVNPSKPKYLVTARGVGYKLQLPTTE
jgi:DNA-binding response OmpR family regulator